MFFVLPFAKLVCEATITPMVKKRKHRDLFAGALETRIYQMTKARSKRLKCTRSSFETMSAGIDPMLAIVKA